MPVLSLWGLPVRPTGQEAVAKVSPGHTCPLPHRPSLWCGDGVVLQWGGPHQLGSHPVPGQRPTTARAAGAGSAPLPCRTSFLCLERIRSCGPPRGFGTSLGRAPARRPSSRGLWVQQGRCCSHGSAGAGTGAGRKPRVMFL